MVDDADPAEMTAEELRAAYLATLGESGDTRADALAAELQHRNEDL
jgi:hypothetical protein